mgnify:CR=1 FL=1
MKWEEQKQNMFAIKQLVTREVKRKYARSYLGIVWSVLNPLMSMAIMSMIFSTMFRRSIENFPIYYLTGNIFWQMFSGATNSAMTALVDNKMLLMKVKMPKQTFVLARVYTAFTNFGYTCIAYVFMLIIFRIQVSWTMVLFLFPVLFLLLFSMGIGYLLSILYVFFGDIKHLYSVVLTLWMYLCAIFYPVTQLSEQMQAIVSMNPLYTFIDFARQCVMYQTVPEPMQWFKMMAWGIGIFGFGYWFFKKNENTVMQKI